MPKLRMFKQRQSRNDPAFNYVSVGEAMDAEHGLNQSQLPQTYGTEEGPISMETVSDDGNREGGVAMEPSGESRVPKYGRRTRGATGGKSW